MKICKRDEAITIAWSLYWKQRKFRKVYVFHIKIHGREFAAIFTEHEAVENKLKKDRAALTFGAHRGDEDRWRRKHTLYTNKSCNEVMQYMQAAKTKEKILAKWKKEYENKQQSESEGQEDDQSKED